MKSMKKILKGKKKDYTSDMAERHKYITKEFQDYGYRIAAKLGQEEQASLYIKIAKEKPRALVEQAFSFAIDYPNAQNRGKLFMWKLHELEKEAKEKKEKEERKAQEEQLSFDNVSDPEDGDDDK